MEHKNVSRRHVHGSVELLPKETKIEKKKNLGKRLEIKKKFTNIRFLLKKKI